MNKQNNKFAYLSHKSTEHQTLFVLSHPLFSATISEFGGQLLNFTPSNKREMIWTSKSAFMDTTKPIRGGAPICWPWFGAAPERFQGEPQHGYARNVKWQIESVIESDSEVKLTLVPMFSNEVSSLLGLTLKVEYTFSNTVCIALITTNTGDENFDLSLAIHTYLNFDDISEIKIPKLSGCQYKNKLNNKLETQLEPFAVNEAMDRIYLYSEPALEVELSNTAISIENCGNDSIVVWTPWQQGAEAMVDFDNNGYLSMLCVETALTQGFTLEPGASHTVSQQLFYAD